MANLLLALVGVALVWRVGAVVLRLVAWVLVVLIVFTLVVGVGVPTAAPTTALACWAGAEVLFRLRSGSWRSLILGAAAGWAAAPIGDATLRKG